MSLTHEHWDGRASDLENCLLCEWRCGVNRLAGEVGVCGIGLPLVASRTLHPAPPSSYTIFMAGCNFRCLFCQNWDIAHYPDTGGLIDGACDPDELAMESIRAINSLEGKLIGADRIFFSGGSPTCSLPFVESVVAAARRRDPSVKVNFDTNGFMTEQALERVLAQATSITFDIRAFHEEVHRAMTGAPAAPVLRNARFLAECREKLWEFRVLVVPEINETEVEPICGFLAELDPSLPVCFLAFRPNFVLEEHMGATRAVMERAVATARKVGLRNAYWSGHVGLTGTIIETREPGYQHTGASLAGAYAAAAGCTTHPRDCGHCARAQACPVKGYRPTRRT